LLILQRIISYQAPLYCAKMNDCAPFGLNAYLPHQQTVPMRELNLRCGAIMIIYNCY